MEKTIGFIMMPTLDCNLSCDYCFAKRQKQYMGEEALYQLFTKVRKLSNKLNAKTINFYWQGGEVFLLSPAWFEKMNRVSNYVFNNNPEDKYTLSHKIQSNLILYNSEWKNVVQHVFNASIGSSMDFPNIYRKVSGRSHTEFEKLWIEKREEALKDGFTVGIITVPNKMTLEVGAREFYDYFIKKIKTRYFQINLPYTIYNKREIYNLDKTNLANFLKQLFEIWWKEGLNNGISISPFNKFLERFIDFTQNRLSCVHSKSCGSHFFCIAPDGGIGLCDCWVSSYPEYNYGNIFTDSVEEIINSVNRQKFIQRLPHILDSDCLKCKYCSICFGGCIIRTYSSKNTIMDKDYYCEVYKEMFNLYEYYANNHRNFFLNNNQPTQNIENKYTLQKENILTSASVFVANTCPNNCIFCAPANKRSEQCGIDNKKIENFIKQSINKDIKTLIFSGAGEPTMNPELVNLVRYAKSCGIKRTVVFTNGYRLNSDLLHRLEEAGNNGFLVSLNGNKPINDFVTRRQGSYDDSLRAIKLIGSSMMELAIKTVLVRPNLEYLKEIISIGIENNCKWHNLGFCEWGGNALKNEELLASYKECQEALDKLDVDLFTNVRLDNFPLCVIYNKKQYSAESGGKILLRELKEENVLSTNLNLGHNTYTKFCTTSNCKYIGVCVGVDKNYLRVRGDSEFKHFLHIPNH
jgi:radical SAM protein with 4Fe4S-binding SPASM domain